MEYLKFLQLVKFSRTSSTKHPEETSSKKWTFRWKLCRQSDDESTFDQCRIPPESILKPDSMVGDATIRGRPGSYPGSPDFWTAFPFVDLWTKVALKNWFKFWKSDWTGAKDESICDDRVRLPRKMSTSILSTASPDLNKKKRFKNHDNLINRQIMIKNLVVY